MDEGRRKTFPLTHGRASAWLNDASTELWHSTPVKKKNGGVPLDTSQHFVLTNFKMEQCSTSPPVPTDTRYHHSSLETELPVSDPSGSTIQRQRKELQLLMAELKDRDKELNTMAASHHKQLMAWEQDRQRVLTLEQKCARLNEELQKRNELIRVLTKRVCVVEGREEEVQKELRVAQQHLSELEQKRQHISQKCQDFEEKNQSLNSTVMALSTQVGSLQVREEELNSMLKLKDKDVTEASSHILDLTGRLRDLETSLMQSRSQESKLLRDLEENKQRYRESRHEAVHLKEELQQHVSQSSSQREEMIRLKQELQLLRRDLALSGEGDSWKDELLELARSKQERTMSELRCLQQVCENQRNDLQLLQLNLNCARESLKEKTSQGSLGREASVESVGTNREEQSSCCQSSEPKLNEAPDLQIQKERRGPAKSREHTPPRPKLRGNHSTSSFHGQLTCSCLKNSGLCDISTLPAACLQASVNSSRGALSAHLTDDGDALSSSFLQQLLDESRQVVIAAPEHSSVRRHSSGLTMSCGTTEPIYFHNCHQSSPKHKASETPPKACPQHCTIQP